MPDIAKIDHWIDKTGDAIQEDEFFLRSDDFYAMYDKVKEANATLKYYVDPVEQLSLKGLALISSIYAKKDKTEAQPLVASTVGG